jgi:hypothetical protein
MVKLVRIMGFLMLLLMIGGGAFLAGRVFLADKGQAEAEVALPLPTIEPGPSLPESAPTVAESTPALAEQGPPKPFEGELNGFTFYNPANFDTWALLRAWSPKCSGSVTTGTNVRYATGEEGIASRLNFAVTYLPPGAEQAYVAVSACEDDVIAMSREYTVQGGIVQVGRVSGPPYVLSAVPRDLLEATTIGGRPAVISKPLISNPKGRMAIYMRDHFSVWTISGFQISLEVLIKVADGVK